MDPAARPTDCSIVALIGATGRLGKHVLRGALERGYSVRALVRDPSKVDGAENLTVVKGNVLDEGSVTELVRGADCVLSCLGSRPKETMVVAPGTRAIVNAIQSLDPSPRLVHLSSLGVGDSYRQCRQLSWLFAFLAIPVLPRRYFADMDAAEEVLRGVRGVSIVTVRPTVLRDTAENSGYACRTPSDPPGRLFVSRRAVAAFILDSVKETAWDGQAVSVFSGSSR